MSSTDMMAMDTAGKALRRSGCWCWWSSGHVNGA